VNGATAEIFSKSPVNAKMSNIAMKVAKRRIRGTICLNVQLWQIMNCRKMKMMTSSMKIQLRDYVGLLISETLAI
jgi:hypothetical protein